MIYHVFEYLTGEENQNFLLCGYYLIRVVLIAHFFIKWILVCWGRHLIPPSTWCCPQTQWSAKGCAVFSLRFPDPYPLPQLVTFCEAGRWIIELQGRSAWSGGCILALFGLGQITSPTCMLVPSSKWRIELPPALPACRSRNIYLTYCRNFASTLSQKKHPHPKVVFKG